MMNREDLKGPVIGALAIIGVSSVAVGLLTVLVPGQPIPKLYSLLIPVILGGGFFGGSLAQKAIQTANPMKRAQRIARQNLDRLEKQIGGIYKLPFLGLFGDDAAKTNLIGTLSQVAGLKGFYWAHDINAVPPNPATNAARCLLLIDTARFDIALLKNRREKRPLDGALVAVDQSHLPAPLSIREQIDKAIEALQFNFPIYLIFWNADRAMGGFNDFLGGCQTQPPKPFGALIEGNNLLPEVAFEQSCKTSNPPLRKAGDSPRALSEWLEDCELKSLQATSPLNLEGRRRIARFLEVFRDTVTTKLKPFVASLFEENISDDSKTPLFRGFFFLANDNQFQLREALWKLIATDKRWGRLTKDGQAFHWRWRTGILACVVLLVWVVCIMRSCS